MVFSLETIKKNNNIEWSCFYTFVVKFLFRWKFLLSFKLHFKFTSVVMQMYYWNKLSPFFVTNNVSFFVMSTQDDFIDNIFTR